MNKRQKPSPGKRGATVAAVLCFVAAIAIVGTYTFNDYRQTQEKEKLAQAEEAEKNAAEEANNLVIDNQKDTNNTSDTEDKEIDNTSDAEDDMDDDTDDDAQDSQGSGQSAPTAGTAASASFTDDSHLLWPVDGVIIMSYSMDKTVYFKTLDQYKYNPAILLSAAEGDQVISATNGTVKSIDIDPQTGTTVNVDIGNGYELFYGQLKEVAVSVGENVEAKTVLGYVSEPTKYYSVEGSNVYFEMRKDGQPVNPAGYLE